MKLRTVCAFLTVALALASEGSHAKPGLAASPEAQKKFRAILRDQARELVRLLAERRFDAAQQAAEQGFDLARRLRNPRYEVMFLGNLAQVHYRAFRYRTTLRLYLSAAEIARKARSWDDLARVHTALSSVYLEFADANAALLAIQNAMRACARLADAADAAAATLRLEVTLQAATVFSELGRSRESEELYEDGIERARAMDAPAREAWAWDKLGVSRLKRGELDAAEDAHSRAYALRLRRQPDEISLSRFRLSVLRLEQGDAAAAGLLLERAFRDYDFLSRTLPPYVLHHHRARVSAALGGQDAALEAYRDALHHARRWRNELPKADPFWNSSNSALYRGMLGEYVSLGAGVAMERKDDDLKKRILLDLEDIRSSTFQHAVSARGSGSPLPAVYWDRVSELRRLETRLLEGFSAAEARRCLELRLELAELESLAAGTFSTRESENFHTWNSLILSPGRAQGKERAFFSFAEGKANCYVWSVTSDGIQLRKLPGSAELRRQVAEFRDAVEGNRPEALRLGRNLYRLLFADSDAQSSAEWVLSLDEPLFDLPFAALVAGDDGGRPVFLVERHSLRHVFGLVQFRPPAGRGGDFIGVGDPVYNRADDRYQTVSWTGGLLRRGPVAELNRLVGSGPEVQWAAKNWTGGEALVMTGSSVSPAGLARMLTGFTGTVHLATHVVPTTARGEAMIALGLNQDGQQEAWTVQDVAALQIPGALVVLSGCESGGGAPAPGAGLVGLARAWLIAGAAEVVGAQWPVPDHHGEIWKLYYQSLNATGRGNPGNAAAALQRAQISMLRSRSWQAGSRSWAGYRVLEGSP
ncbi:MAG: CHAT domain-containing protein [Bryobacteraceae bacterium]|nr:CHAT domain-containing protein [Bryobacteraceae bacterium]